MQLLFDCCVIVMSISIITICNGDNYSSPRRISTKPIASDVSHGVWMATVHSEGDSYNHRPSDLLITHA